MKIDFERSRTFDFERPDDCLSRPHRYLLYCQRRFLGSFKTLTDLYRFIESKSFDRYIVSWQYLGFDCHFHTFKREYLYTYDTQLSLFN